jgi:MFS family permease
LTEAPRTLWRHRDFLHLWSAQAVSAFGSRITRTALPVIAVLLVTEDPIEIAILSALGVLPGIVVGLFAGGFIDRRPKRPILVAADLVRAVLVFSVPIAAWFSELTMPQLYVVAALVGAASAVFRLADNAYLPALIGREALIEGNSKLETTESIAEIGGPGLAGILIQWLTAPVAMVVDAVSYLASALLLFRIRARERIEDVAARRASVLEDIRIGLRAGFGHPIVGRTLWAIAIGEFCNGFFMALYSLYALRTLGLDVATLGLVISLGGIGALAGAFVAARLSNRLGLGRALVVSLLLGNAANLFVPAASLAPTYGAAFLSASQLLGDGCLVAFFILANSYRQAALPLDVQARAGGMLQALSGVLLPSGALIAGAIAAATSAATALWIGVIGSLFAVAPLLRRSILALERY